LLLFYINTATAWDVLTQAISLKTRLVALKRQVPKVRGDSLPQQIQYRKIIIVMVNEQSQR